MVERINAERLPRPDRLQFVRIRVGVKTGQKISLEDRLWVAETAEHVTR
jgi:hypothetical protein